MSQLDIIYLGGIMRKVNLNMKEQYYYKTIKSLADNKISKQGAATRLNISIRHVNRLLMQYQEHGKSSFIHGNRNKTSNRAISDTTKKHIIHLYQTKYAGSNFTHFSELLSLHEGINVSTTFISKLLWSVNIISPKSTRRKKKELKTKLKVDVSSSNTKSNSFSSSDIKEVNKSDIHPSFERKKYFGEEIQLDASVHLWFGDTKSHLHAAIDNSTGQIVGLYFDWQETLNGYYNVYKQILETYGIPYLFKTDRRTVFEYKQKKAPSIQKDTFTQFAFACKQFGTYIQTTSSPQAKGQIERLFGSLQSRLIIELRIRNITTIDEANLFLHKYIKLYNSKFALPINYNSSVFECVNNTNDIIHYLSIRVPRVIDNGSCINFKNKIYYPSINNERKYFDYRTKALVIQTLDNNLFVTIGDEIYNLTELKSHHDISNDFDTLSITTSTKKTVYRPPMSHPWKRASFEKFISKQKHINFEDYRQIFD